MLSCGCRSTHAGIEPSIEFTKLPPAGEGSTEKLDAIEGTVTGAQPGQRIVLFAKAGVWWVQPWGNQPFTAIQGAHWRGTTHPGSSYAALLVGPGFQPVATAKSLPQKGGDVLAVATVERTHLARPVGATLRFSGYEWAIRETPGNPGGSRNLYDPANATVDEKGWLHLRIVNRADVWSAAEVNLTRSLGYGSYRFVVHDVSQLEPAAVLSFSIYDNSGPPREMDIEISRWGEAIQKNAQYVIQPYYVPANVVRFLTPPGVLTHSFSWQHGQSSFNTVRGSKWGAGVPTVAQHVFTSGIPSPGNESIHMNLYAFFNRTSTVRRETEVIIEKFEYLP